MKNAENARNYSQCDSILIGINAVLIHSHTFDVRNPSAQMEHEASTSRLVKISYFIAIEVSQLKMLFQ